MDKFDEKVIGYDSIKETLRQIADVLKRPEAYKEKGVSMPRGLLMESAPGLGKSLMASILMEESGRKSFVFRRINEGNTFLGEMKDIFDVAKEEAPSILLLEDLNLYVESNSPYAPEWACLQACIDETSDADIFVIATTNDTRYMPQSLLRPGRFDYILNLNPPLGKTAENIVSYYLRDKNLAKDVQISDIVKAMPQVSCATLETVMNLAAINSVYRDHAHVQKEDIIDALLKVVYAIAMGESCTIKDSTFIDCVGFIGCGCASFIFSNNKVYGACSRFLSFGIKDDAKIINSHFLFVGKPSFEFKDENNQILKSFIDCQGKNVFIENNIFECEKSINASSYMSENNICVISGSARIGYDDETAKGTVSNCTFVRMNKCIEHIGTVKDCIFEKCSEAIIECGFLITENRFSECKNAIVNLCSRATLSNCQFIDCAGKELVTSRWNSQVTIQDCEFSNVSLSPVNSLEDIKNYDAEELQKYIFAMIPGKFLLLNTKGVLINIGGVDKKFANANRPSKIERCIFNGVCICSEGGFACDMGKWKACKADRNLSKDQMNFLISVYTANYDRFNYPRVIVSDCTFKNCASVHQEIINTEPYDSVFGSRHNYTAISVRNNYGLDNIGDPTSYMKSSDVKLKETDANGNKIGCSLSVN